MLKITMQQGPKMTPKFATYGGLGSNHGVHI